MIKITKVIFCVYIDQLKIKIEIYFYRSEYKFNFLSKKVDVRSLIILTSTSESHLQFFSFWWVLCYLKYFCIKKRMRLLKFCNIDFLLFHFLSLNNVSVLLLGRNKFLKYKFWFCIVVYLFLIARLSLFWNYKMLFIWFYTFSELTYH